MKTVVWVLVALAVVCLPLLAFAQADRWTAPAKFTPPLTDVTVTSTATVLCPANDNQVNCTCRNNGTETMRVGDSTVTTTKGLPVLPDESIEIRTRSAVYGISVGADVSVACLTEVQ